MAVSPAADFDLLALDRALEALAAVDERKSRVIEMRFFGGMTVEETAEALRVSTDTVKRDWRLAKLWLLTGARSLTDIFHVIPSTTATASSRRR